MLGGNKLSFSHVALTVGLVLLATVVGSSVKQKFADKEEKDDYEMVKKYLLNDNVLYGKNRPKIWIHSKYEVNARKWKNFMSRNSKDLNQPYLYLTVQSIINHCGDDFHICLIDDESFEKLIPTWTIDLSTVPEPMQTRYRQNALLQLVYIYGGMIVPNSFLCLQSLLPIYKQGVSEKTPFMGEELVRLPNSPQSKPFLPGLQFMGAAKEDPLVEKLIGFLQSLEEKQHFQNETEFNYNINRWCNTQRDNGFIRCVEGHIIGTKDKMGKPIILDDLMSEEYLDLEDNSLHGIIIPSAELLRRPNYQYFSILPVQDILSTNCILTKYFQISMSKLNSSNINNSSNYNKSIVSI